MVCVVCLHVMLYEKNSTKEIVHCRERYISLLIIMFIPKALTKRNKMCL